ncbi:hypothetical protein [Histidinibacterium lentulum]|uniref:hypothetical protein n=1 Tax=Histidinibacterium lentulum TaxID=2480588 RepID=UPI000F4C3C26|nr:hypothetical protein [Histidinibacterium lentulum]
MTSDNPVFDLLGAEGDDIEALTAYGLYKRHKRAWAKEFTAANGSPPTSADDKAFAKVASTEDQLERYRKDARDILIAFANQTVDESRADIEREAITARIEKAATEVGSQTSFWKQVGFGIVATAINTLILIILAVGIRLSGIDFLDMLQEIGAPTELEDSTSE